MKKFTKTLSKMFSRKKEPPPKKKAPAEPSVKTVVDTHEDSPRILTAEGWKRMMMRKAKKN